MEDNMKKSIAILCLLAINIPAYSVIWHNDLNCIFTECPDKASIERHVVIGSVYFLESKSNAELLLMEYEKSALQSFNCALALEYTEKAISGLESAKANYLEAKNTGERIGYIETKTGWFKEFDYDRFIIDNSLDKEIAGRVKTYLVKTDILGIYGKAIEDIDKILITLGNARNQLQQGKRPGIQVFWALFQQYAEAALFGNYATMMGMNVLGDPDQAVCKPVE
jgi:hypothetical protein